MNFVIESDCKELTLKNETCNPEYIIKYNTNSVVDLEDFILYLSDSTSVVDCKPATFSEFVELNKEHPVAIIKLAEYIYNIIGVFNNSFNEIYSKSANESPSPE